MHVCEREYEYEAASQWPAIYEHICVSVCVRADDNADGDGIKRVKIAMCVRKRAKVLKWSTCVLVIVMTVHVCMYMCVCVCVFAMACMRACVSACE